MIHELMDATEIYDAQTAEDLGPVLIVGDDYAGNCEAYDPTTDWTFGSIGSNGEFESMADEYPTIADWLLFLLADQ